MIHSCMCQQHRGGVPWNWYCMLFYCTEIQQHIIRIVLQPYFNCFNHYYYYYYYYKISDCKIEIKIKIYRTIILPVVLYGCEAWSLTLREERNLRVFEKMVLRRIFGPRRDEVTGEWRRLHNEELNDLYSSPNIVHNHFCRGTAKSITYSEGVCVCVLALGIRHAKCMFSAP